MCAQVERVYLVEERTPSEQMPFCLNLDEVFVLDRAAKTLERAPVLWNEAIGPDDDHTQLQLRHQVPPALLRACAAWVHCWQEGRGGMLLDGTTLYQR